MLLCGRARAREGGDERGRAAAMVAQCCVVATVGDNGVTPQCASACARAIGTRDLTAWQFEVQCTHGTDIVDW